MLNQHSEEIDGKKYANYNLNSFVKNYINNTDLTDTLKTNLDSLDRDTTYVVNTIPPYKIKDEVMQYLINCGTWKFIQKNPYTSLIHIIPLTSSNYNTLNKQYLKNTDTITDISFQKKLSSNDESEATREFEQIFFYQDGKSSKRKRQRSKKLQSSKRKSRKRQSSKRKSKRKSFFK
jgi:hypothetical protein